MGKVDTHHPHHWSEWSVPLLGIDERPEAAADGHCGTPGMVVSTVGLKRLPLDAGLAGIQPDPAAGGFRHFSLRPHVVGDLEWVRRHDQKRMAPQRQ